MTVNIAYKILVRVDSLSAGDEATLNAGGIIRQSSCPRLDGTISMTVDHNEYKMIVFIVGDHGSILAQTKQKKA